MRSIFQVSGCIVIASLFIISCNSLDSNRQGDLETIDLEAMVKNNKAMGLSSIARDIRYIPLETLPEAMLNPSKLLYVNKNIYVLNRTGEVYLFDENGGFIRQIGEKGKGPGEYINAQYMEVSPDGSIIYLYNMRFGSVLYTYDLNSTQLNSSPIKYPTWRFAPLEDGRHIMISPYGSFSPDSANFLFYVQDIEGKVIRKYPSTRVIKMMGDFSIGAFFINPKSILAYQPFCDTVFRVDGEGNMNPEYLLDFGDHRAPDELYSDMNDVMNPTEPYYLKPSLHQTKNQLFVRIRRLKKYHIGIYHPNNKEVYSFISDNGRIPNDIDGGPDFWPSGTDGKNIVYKIVEPVDLLNPDEKEIKQKHEIKDTAKAKSYQDLLKSLDENDNPVVMVVQLKNP